MPVKIEGKVTAEYILSEASGARSRDQAKIASGAGQVEAGTILGKITASGKFAPHDSSATDGSEAAIAILYANVDATDADARCVISARDCEVKKDDLIYHADIDTDTEIDAVNASLAANGIIVR